MWEWVEPALQYGSGPAIAAAALLWQQRRTDRRETERRREDVHERERDRQHQRDLASADRQAQRDALQLEHAGQLSRLQAELQAQQERAIEDRRAALDDEWREARRHAHVRFYNLADAALTRLFSATWALPLGEDGAFVPLEKPLSPLGESQLSELDEATAEVGLLGSSSTAKAAHLISRSIRDANMVVWFGTDEQFAAKWPKSKFSSHYDTARKSLAEYLQDVRRELGTE